MKKDDYKNNGLADVFDRIKSSTEKNSKGKTL